ncbi:PrgI family protein [Phaeacidiphilus oryzae]|uniref:PrgI family protein n=1 Tax=Phaeacidiphilus oryzae TaxID=348818 RepID=UPI00068CD3DE|nr:PrgI family protein [Phaeacidiphilus oryzae]
MARESENEAWESLVKIPAVDHQDRLIGNLTTRQCVQLGAVGAALWIGWQAGRPWVPPLFYAVGAGLVLAVAAAVVLARRDGVGMDRWLAAALRHHRSSKRLVPTSAPQQLPAPLAALRLPIISVADDGVLALADGTRALLSRAGTVNLALRTRAEQRGLLGAMGRWLNGLTGPVQILVRAHRLDLAARIGELEHAARGLPHPLLEQAALDHAAFLAALGEQPCLLTRQVLLVHRESGPDSAAGARLHARAAESSGLLAAAEVPVTPLDAGAAWTALEAACDPAAPPPSPDPALPGRPVIAPGVLA